MYLDRFAELKSKIEMAITDCVNIRFSIPTTSLEWECCVDRNDAPPLITSVEVTGEMGEMTSYLAGLKSMYTYTTYQNVVLYFSGGSSFSFKIEDPMGYGKVVPFVLAVLFMALEVPGILIVSEEVIRNIDRMPGAYYNALLEHMMILLNDYGAEKAMPIFAKYRFFSFKDLVLGLQQQELYAILAEVLDTGNKLGFIGTEDEML